MAGPYRATYREVDVDQIAAADEPLEVFSVSGPAGAHGRHGFAGSHGSGSGASGGRGSDAGPSQRGADAGTIHVTLRTGSADGILALSGTQTSALGETSEIKSILSIGTAGTVNLLAEGGRGGDGGDGGRGGDGATGYRGSDATRTSSGTNGGPGGSGGTGGNGSSGAEGGRAGSIVLDVADEDSQLLMLVNHALSGGIGGNAGRNGGGGSGGAGGSGGSSYSWTTTSYSTDSEGNRTSSTQYHSNPGGSRGSTGARGSSGSAVLHKGQRGDRGTLAINLQTKEGVEQYDSCYDLALESYAHESLNKDSVYEPGERIRVFDICIRNVGGMPTPRHRDITTRLVRAGWVNPESDQKLVLPRGIAADETTTHEDELHFTIGDYVPEGPSDPLEREETLGLRATLPSVSRDFTRYDSEKSTRCGLFVIRFPVRLSKIEALHSLAPGQVGRIRFQVVNQSTGDLGRESDCGRVLRVHLNLHESELGPDQVDFLDTRGKIVSLKEGFTYEIPLLKAGESASLEVALGMPADVEHYRSAKLRFALELGHLNEPDKARPIQYREFSTRVSRPYRQMENADLLIVVNQGTTRQELEAWNSLAANLGLTLNTWDMSLEGHLDLERSLGRNNLIEDFEGKTIVVLDCEIDTPMGPTRPHLMLEKEQFFRAVAEGINFSFLGPDFDMAKMLVRTKGELREWAGSPKLLVESIDDARDLHDDQLQGLDCRVAIHGKRWWWQQPKEEELAKRARALQDQLRDEHPDRRYIVVYDFEPEQQSKALISRKWKLGACSVIATLDSAAGTLVHATVTEKQLHDPEFVLSDGNVTTLLLTKSLGEKLVRLDELLYRDGIPALLGNTDSESEELVAPSPSFEHMLGLLVQAIGADLGNEIAAVLSNLWRSGLSSAEMKRSLPLLHQVSEFRLSGSPHPPGSPGGDQLIRMIALTLFSAKSQASWWEWIPPFVFMRRSIVLRRQVHRLMDVFIESSFGEHADIARKHIKKAIKDEKKLWSASKKYYDGPRKRARYAQSLLLSPITRQEITTDAEILSDKSMRILAEFEFDAIAQADRGNDERRAAAVSANRDSRTELLRTEAASALSGTASP